MEVQVNWAGVLLATIVGMVVGFVWYAKPVFGDMWQKLVKLDEKKAREGAVKAIVQALVAGLLTAYIIAHVAYISFTFFDVSFMSSALQTAFWLWLGISATTVVTHNAFEQRPTKLTVLTVAHQLVTFLAMAVVIGWMSP